MDLQTPIPRLEFPGDHTGNGFICDKLVSVQDYFGGKIIVEPVYYNMGISRNNSCYIRELVAKRLEMALYLLPEGFTFKTYDGWRAIDVQQNLYNDYFQLVKNRNPHMSIEELEAETKKFVSKPSRDSDCPSVHNTGGAIDLTLFDETENKELDMGTPFDDFSHKAYTYAFEEKTVCERDEEIRRNRRMLYNCMTNAGFTNLPTEWWHYDFGDRFWSFYTGKPAMFRGILRLDE